MLEKSVKSLKSQLKKRPDDPKVLRELVGMLRSAGKFDQAISMLEKYLSKHPDDFEVMICHGETLLDVQAFEDAIRVFMRTSELRPCAESHYNLARAYDLKGMYEEAIKEHNAAIELEPDCAEAYYRLGMTYGRSGKHE